MINCSYVSNINRSVTGISVIKTIHLETAVRAKKENISILALK